MSEIKQEEQKYYGTQKQQLTNLTKEEYETLKTLCWVNKNLYNVALYNLRQSFFDDDTKFLSYIDNYKLCKDNENYIILNKNMAQQTIKDAQASFSSYFALVKRKKAGNYYKKVKIPNYLEKDGHYTLTFAEFNIKDGKFNVPMSPQFKKENCKIAINVPSNILEKEIKEVRIIPKNNGKFFEIQYTYLVEKEETLYNTTNVLGLDLGVVNFITAVSTLGEAFIIDGKHLKNINQWANKQNARLQGIKDKQNIPTQTKAQFNLWNKRQNRITDYSNKSVKYIIDYCKTNDIGKIVLGYTPTFQNKSKLGRVNNQNFVNIPYGQFKSKLEKMCERHNIELQVIEESYTSKSSFIDKDEIPVYDVNNPRKYTFSGERIARGLYKSKEGIILNSDINGALNILRKAGHIVSILNKSVYRPKRVYVLEDESQKIDKNKEKSDKKEKIKKECIKKDKTDNNSKEDISYKNGEPKIIKNEKADELVPSPIIKRPKKQFKKSEFDYLL
jgi:putative transposase